MSTVLLKAANSDHKAVLPPDSIKHCAYIKGILEGAPEGEVEIEVPETDHTLINFMIEFLKEHANDEEVTEGWEKEKPRPLTGSDKELLEPIVGKPLIYLLKASNFIGCQLMLNAVSTYVASVLVTKDVAEVQQYFGVFREFTKEEEEQVKAKYPVPFY